MNTAPAARPSAAEMMIGYFRNSGVLKETRSEHWDIQLVNLLDCTFYFVMLTIASVLLSQDLGLEDESAGYVVTIFTCATSVMLLFPGMYTDWLGIRKSVNVSMGALPVLRLAMVVVGLIPSLPHRGILAGILFLLMAPFMAAIQTTFQSATKRPQLKAGPTAR